MEVQLKSKPINKSRQEMPPQQSSPNKILEEGMSTSFFPWHILQFLPLTNVTPLHRADCRAEFLWFCPSHRFWLFKAGFPLIKKIRVFPCCFYIEKSSLGPCAFHAFPINYEGSTPPCPIWWTSYCLKDTWSQQYRPGNATWKNGKDSMRVTVTGQQDI